MIVTARVERIGDTDSYRVVINHDGRIVMDGESFTVCSQVAQALVDSVIDSSATAEIDELAQAIKRVHTT